MRVSADSVRGGDAQKVLRLRSSIRQEIQDRKRRSATYNSPIMRQIVLAFMPLAILPGTAQTQHPAKQERAVVYDDVTRDSDADDRDLAR